MLAAPSLRGGGAPGIVRLKEVTNCQNEVALGIVPSVVRRWLRRFRERPPRAQRVVELEARVHAPVQVQKPHRHRAQRLHRSASVRVASMQAAGARELKQHRPFLTAGRLRHAEAGHGPTSRHRRPSRRRCAWRARKASPSTSGHWCRRRERRRSGLVCAGEPFGARRATTPSPLA